MYIDTDAPLGLGVCTARTRTATTTQKFSLALKDVLAIFTHSVSSHELHTRAGESQKKEKEREKEKAEKKSFCFSLW